MFPYILVFLLSIFCVYFAQRNTTRGKISCFILGGVAILLPSFLAGFRDSTIGTDILTYVNNTWEDILRTTSIADLLKKNADNYYPAADIGYLFLNYVLAGFSRNVHLIYFGISFFIMLLLYYTVKDNTNKMSWALAFFMFYFMYYNYSLNVMRQMLAMSIGLYAYKYVENNQWFRVAISCIIMYLFHSTSLVYILIISLFLVNKLQNKKTRFFIYASTVFVILLFFENYDRILSESVRLGVISAHYLMYESSEGVFQTSLLILYSIFEFVFVISTRVLKNEKERQEIGYYAVFHLVGMVLSMLSIVMYDANRLAQYLLYISIVIFIPRTLALVKKNNYRFYQRLLLLTTTICVIGWFYLIVYLGHNETYPYKSEILGI